MIDWWQVIWADSPIKLYMMACCFVVVIGLGKSGGCEKESNLKKRRKKKKRFFWQTFFLFYLLPFFLKWDKQFAFSIFFIYIFYDKLCFFNVIFTWISFSYLCLTFQISLHKANNDVIISSLTFAFAYKDVLEQIILNYHPFICLSLKDWEQ